MEVINLTKIIKSNKIQIDEEYEINSLEDYLLLFQTNIFESTLDKAFTILKDEDLINLDVKDFITRLNTGIELVDLNDGFVPLWAYFFDDILNFLERKVGDYLIQQNAMKTYKMFLQLHTNFKNFKNYYITKDLVNFTSEQENQQQLVNELFNNNILEDYLDLISN